MNNDSEDFVFEKWSCANGYEVAFKPRVTKQQFMILISWSEVGAKTVGKAQKKFLNYCRGLAWSGQSPF